MAYTLNYAEKKNKFDEQVVDKGVTVFIDPRALMHVIGTKMDFVDNEVVSEFVFDNPNAKGTCGCGESFNVWRRMVEESESGNAAFWTDVLCRNAKQPGTLRVW